jgi:hypothetical protein
MLRVRRGLSGEVGVSQGIYYVCFGYAVVEFLSVALLEFASFVNYF